MNKALLFFSGRRRVFTKFAAYAPLLFLCLFGWLCTSSNSRPYPYKPLPPWYRPVYMGWEQFRASSFLVMTPRTITRRGKIYVKDDLLFMSEPGRGIHLFDNENPRKPRPLAFLKIPGNYDLAIRGQVLYADSFTDLLVIRLDADPEKIKLVRRLNEVFPYQPYRELPADARYAGNEKAEKKRGVVLEWKGGEKEKGGRTDARR